MAVPNVNQFLPTTVYGSFRNENLGFPGFTALPATAYFKGSLEVDGNCQFDGGSNDFTYSVPTCSIAPTANNMLCNKLYVDTHGGGGGGATGPTGPQGASATIGQYGSFLNLNAQTNPTADSVNKVPFTLDIANGISVISTTRITISTTGTYQIIFSAEFTKSNTNNDQVDMWLMKNGTNINYTNSSLTIAGSNTEFMPTVNFIIDFIAGDYFELVWSSPSTTISLFSQAALTNPVRPNVPSVILTVAQVMNTIAGPTGPQGPTGTNAVNLLPLSNVFTGNSNEFQSGVGGPSVFLYNGGVVCDGSLMINNEKYIWFGTRTGPDVSTINYQMTFRGAGYTDMGYYVNNNGSKHTFSTVDLTGNDVTNLQIAYNKLSVYTPTTFDILPLVGVQPLATQAYAQSLVLSGPTGPAGTNGTNGLDGATGPIGPTGPAGGGGGGGDVSLAGDNIFTGNNSFTATNTGIKQLKMLQYGDNIAIYGSSINNAFTATTGIQNICFGNAGQNITTGNYNYVVADVAGFNLSSGDANFIMGSYAGSNITSGSNNICVGAQSGAGTSGSYSNSTNIGYGAGSNQNSDNNISIGFYSGAGSNFNGDGYNSSIGGWAGYGIGNGQYLTCIGAYSGTDNLGNYSNSTALGRGAMITKSNQIMLGRNTEEVNIPGSLIYNTKLDTSQGNSTSTFSLTIDDAYKTVPCNPTGAKIILLPDPSTIPNGCWFCINNYSTNISGIIQVKDYTNTSIYATINYTTSNNLGGTSIKLATDGSTYFNSA